MENRRGVEMVQMVTSDIDKCNAFLIIQLLLDLLLGVNFCS